MAPLPAASTAPSSAAAASSTQAACCSSQNGAAAAAAATTTPRPSHQDTTSRQILQLMRELSHSAFSGVLLHGNKGSQDNPHSLEALDLGPGPRVRVRLRVPLHLCDNDAFLNSGAIMAWFDEVSSWGFVSGDGRHRPGVSVSLNTTLLGWVGAGAEVEIESQCKKVGDTLGFADMVLREVATGRELATGRHVKFLRMGTAWAVAMHPWAFPFAHFLATTLYLPGLRGGGGGKKGIQLLPPDAEGGAVVGRGERNVDINLLLNLQNFLVVQDPSSPFSSPSSFSSNLNASATFFVAPAVCNSFGSLHGGAVAMLAERAALLLYQQAARWAGKEESVKRARVRTLSVDYMSPCSKNTELLLVIEGTRTELPPSSSSFSSSSSMFPNLSPSSSSQEEGGSIIPTSYRVWFTRKSDGRYLTQCHVLFDANSGVADGSEEDRRRKRRARL